jgi:PAS domain S-box-containing protein
LRLLSTAVESAVNGIAVTDRKGEILWVNPAFTRLTGYSREEVLGKNPRILKSGLHSPEFYNQMWATLLRGEPWHGELVNRRKDGSLHPEEMTIAPVKAGGAGISHFVAVKHDITARKRAERRMELLAETARRLLGSDHPRRVVEELCRNVLDFLDCQFFFNYLADDARPQLRLNACAGITEAEAAKIEWLDYGAAIFGCAARDASRIVVGSIQETPDPRTELVKSYGVQVCACHPLVVAGSVLGTLSFGARNRKEFTAEELSFMEAVADLVATAIQRERSEEALRQAEAALHKEHAQLEEKVRERTTDLSALNQVLQAEILQRQRAEEANLVVLRRLAEAEETERGRISRELHDRLGQDLTALKLGLQNLRRQGPFAEEVLESLSKQEKLAEDLMRDLHRLAWELRPPALDDLGLKLALQRLVDEWSRNTGVNADLHTGRGLGERRLPHDFETTLYRIAQEALTNVARHAKAQRVCVLLERRPGYVSLIVEDDGCGFDAQSALAARAGQGRLGLLGMQERAKLAGGSLTIESAPGGGATVFARLPLQPEAENQS